MSDIKGRSTHRRSRDESSQSPHYNQGTSSRSHKGTKKCERARSRGKRLERDDFRRSRSDESRHVDPIDREYRVNRTRRSRSPARDRKRYRSKGSATPKRQKSNEDIKSVKEHSTKRIKGDLIKVQSPEKPQTSVKETTSTTPPEVSVKTPLNGLDYFAQLRALGGTVSTNPLEKAAVRAAQYLAMDPLEKMRRQVEQTLEAKLSLLQTKLDNARDPKNKTQRKIYVGNLTPHINGEFLRQLFTQTLLISYPQWNVPGQDCVVEIQYRDGNKYCFLELRTMDMATAALQVNGVTVLGTQLQVSRPTGFLDPIECDKAVKEAEQELAKFRSGEDEGPMLRQPGYMELITNMKGQQYSHSQPLREIASQDHSTYLSFDGIVTPSALDSGEEVKELYEDIQSKVGEFGQVTRMVIPRPPMGIKGEDIFGKGHYGKAFVQFATAEAAEAAKTNLHGIPFDGRTVVVNYVPDADFYKALGI